MAKNNIIENPIINTIGKGTSIKGDIKSNGDFRIDGKLNGSIQSEGKIVIGETGFIEGEIICQNADISGTVKANIKTSDLLSLKSTCHVDGAIITDKLAIEPGAKFSGTCSMDQKDKAQPSVKTPNEQIRQKEKVTG
jgi:cytoskeletal protein CcmA (bactofilin family)